MLFRSPILSALDTVSHGFGGSVGPRGERLDVPLRPDDGVVSWLSAQVGMPGAPLALARQVHGRDLLWPRVGGLAGDGDALLTRQRGLLLGIRTADCLPVLIVGEDGVAAVHAGWRGVAAGVIPAAIEALGSVVAAAVGPGICVEHYEVGETVIQGIVQAGVPESVFARRDLGPRPHADIAAAAAWQLRAAGCDQVDVLGLCTWDDPRLHSYRLDGDAAGRQVSVIGLC